MRRVWLLFALVLLAPQSPACAWWQGGHMMVAYIACARLTPRAKQEADRLLAIPIGPQEFARNTPDFVSASFWADDIKRAEPRTGPWHFIDIPFSPDHTGPLPAIPTDNVVAALHQQVRILRDPASTDEEKARALRFVIHLVGDIHQPLHCATEVTRALPKGDRGGNLFRLKVGDRPLPDQLHALWDSGLMTFPTGPGMDPPQLSAIPAAVKPIVAAYSPGDGGWRRGRVDDFETWATESSRIARSTAYRGIEPGETVTQAYLDRCARAAQKQVAWAGYRLAALLNDIFK